MVTRAYPQIIDKVTTALEAIQSEQARAGASRGKAQRRADNLNRAGNRFSNAWISLPVAAVAKSGKFAFTTKAKSNLVI